MSKESFLSSGASCSARWAGGNATRFNLPIRSTVVVLAALFAGVGWAAAEADVDAVVEDAGMIVEAGASWGGVKGI